MSYWTAVHGRLCNRFTDLHYLAELLVPITAGFCAGALHMSRCKLCKWTSKEKERPHTNTDGLSSRDIALKTPERLPTVLFGQDSGPVTHTWAYG